MRTARRTLQHPLVAVLVALVLGTLVLQSAGLPHTHAGVPGLYNHEHDFIFMAALGGDVPVPELTTAPHPAPVVAPLPAVAILETAPAPAPYADSRAPPAR